MFIISDNWYVPYKTISNGKWCGSEKYGQICFFSVLVFLQIMFLELLLSSMYISMEYGNEYFAVKL